MVTDFATAELVKVAANAFLATKISFINAIAEVCEADRRRRRRPGRRDRPRRPDRPQVPQRRHRLRRRLPAQGHPGLHRPRRRARRRRRDDLPARGRRHQPAPPRLRGRGSPATMLGDDVSPARGSRVWGAAFKPRQRRRPRLPGPLHRRPAAPARARRSRSTTRRRTDTAPPMSSRPWSTPTPRWRRPGRPTWCCTSPSGRSSGRLDIAAARRGRAQPAAARRPQHARPRGLAGRRLDRAGPGPPLTPVPLPSGPANKRRVGGEQATGQGRSSSSEAAGAQAVPAAPGAAPGPGSSRGRPARCGRLRSRRNR